MNVAVVLNVIAPTVSISGSPVLFAAGHKKLALSSVAFTAQCHGSVSTNQLVWLSELDDANSYIEDNFAPVTDRCV